MDGNDKDHDEMDHDYDSEVEDVDYETLSTDSEMDSEIELESDGDEMDGMVVNALMPSSFVNFVPAFESRYGSHHPFTHITTLQDAMAAAFDVPDRNIAERKPLALYLHHEESIAKNIFAQQIMCNERIRTLLKNQFITYGMDMTGEEHRMWFFKWLERQNIRDVALTVRNMTKDNYPVLIVLVKEHSSIKLAAYCTGQHPVDDCMRKLMKALQTVEAIKNRASKEEEERLERERLRAEQLAAYEESKAQDREKIAEHRREEEKVREREAKLQKFAEIRQKIRKEVENLPEPTTNAVRISVRFPCGARFDRRFSITDSLEVLFKTVIAHEKCPSDFSLLSSYPRKELACAPEWYKEYATVTTGKVETFKEAGLLTSTVVLVKDNQA